MSMNNTNNCESVSVIVPVYNVEKYLKKCIKSICNQSFRNIEIILVDDGSSDNSPAICDEIAKEDKRIKVIHKANSGVSSARNCGINASDGDYIMFVDSDDWLPADSIELLYYAIKKDSSDFCAGSVCSIWPRGNIVYDMPYLNTPCEDLEQMDTFIGKLNRGPCAKLYKRRIIEDFNISFDEGIKYGEDAMFVYTYLGKCKAVSSINNNVYYYNNLNLVTASRKYYPEIGEWILKLSYGLIKIFFKDVADVKNSLFGQLNVKIIENFIMVCDQAVNSEDFFSNKIDEFYNMFEPIIPTVISSVNSPEAEMYKNVYYPYIKAKQYETLFTYIKNKSLDKQSILYKFTKTAMLKIKYLLIYKFNILYRE